MKNCLWVLFFLASCNPKPSFLADFICPTVPISLPSSLSDPSNRGFLNASGGKLFYWLVPAQESPETAPVALWLNGGPGSSSLLGMWMENGPYYLSRDMTVYPNPGAWNRKVNMIFLDQPAGTGFSNTSEVQGVPESQYQIAARLNEALNDFFDNAHPELSDRDFYVFGESFAGTYIPWVASKIIDDDKLNLKGIGIGDGTIDDLSNWKWVDEYALSHGLITPDQANYINDVMWPRCEWEVKATVANGSNAYPYNCAMIDRLIWETAQNINIYDVASFADYDLRPLSCYLNNAAVKEALGVSPSDTWEINNSNILRERGGDAIYTTIPLVKKALANNVRVLIYHGEKDLLINHVAAESWLASEFGLLELVDWRIGSQLVGRTGSQGLLNYALVYNAGHLLPLDQPLVALSMFETFIF